jgi:hypothetical protein
MTERLRPLLTRFLGPMCTGLHICAKKAILQVYAVVVRNIGMTVGSGRSVFLSSHGEYLGHEKERINVGL